MYSGKGHLNTNLVSHTLPYLLAEKLPSVLIKIALLFKPPQSVGNEDKTVNIKHICVLPLPAGPAICGH